MSWKTKFAALPARGRYLLAGGVLAVLLVAAIAVAGTRSGGKKEGAAAKPAASGGGMEGMAGMSMSADGSVVLTPEQIRQFGVTFGAVEERPLTGQVRTVGIVNFDETRMAQVAPKFGGFIERLYVDFTGQPVRRGQPLAEIYSPELVAAQQELLLAGNLERSMNGSTVPGVPAGSTDLVAAARQRLRLWDISEAQINQVLRTGRVRRTLTLFSPASGIVMEKKVVRGQAVRPGETLYMIADLSEVWVEAELREADAARVRVGAPATIEFAAVPGRRLAGTVDYVYPTLQQQARTLKARIRIPNPGGQIRPGMYANVIFAPPSAMALTVPASAVVRTGERNFVFMDMGGGKLMPMDVEIGRAAGDYLEILSGLEPGQRVVTSAQFLLDSESNLAEVMKGMAGMGGGGGDMKGMDMPAADTAGGMSSTGADMKNMPGMKMPTGGQ